MTLEWPLGMILPWATATISMVPKAAQRNAAVNTAMLVQVNMRPAGDGGASSISSTAGRNSQACPLAGVMRRCRWLSMVWCLSPLHCDVLMAVLVRVQPGVIALALQEFRVGPVLDNASLVEHQDTVGRAHGRQTMGNEEHRTSPTHVGKVALNNGFGLVVKSTGGFVEDEDTRVADQGTRNRQALTLATREGTAVLAHQGIVAFGQLQDEIVRPSEFGSLDNALHGHPRLRQRNVVTHGTTKQKIFLQHH